MQAPFFYVKIFFMNPNGVVIHSNRLVGNGIQGQNLQNGSSVLVRVAAYKGNGVYEGFVAGVKVNISSQKQLQIGQSFPAKIYVKDGLIQLQMKDSFSSFTAGVQISESKFEVLNTLLNNLGLSSNPVISHILHQMKQLEMKFDSQIINKIKNLSLKFKGKEIPASELLLILHEKNIDFSDSDLLNLLMLLDVFNNDNDSKSGKKDDYTLLNKINNNCDNWIFLPFEFVSFDKTENKIDDSEKLGSGVLKILFTKTGNLVKQVNIECLYKSVEYVFVILFECKKCKNVYFNISNVNKNEIVEIINVLNRKIGNNVKIEYKSKEILLGTACELEDFVNVEGSV